MEFRKDALLGGERSNVERKSSSSALPNRRNVNRSTRLENILSKAKQVRVKKSRVVKVLKSKCETSVKSEKQLSLTSPQCPVSKEEEKKEDDAELVVPPRKLRNRASQQSYHEESSSNDEESPPKRPKPNLIVADSDSTLDEPSKLKRGRKGKYHPKPPVPPCRLTNHNLKKVPNCKSATAPVEVSPNRRVELLRSTFRGHSAGFVERDPVTGNISFTTGYGNRFRSYRTTITFKHLEIGDGKMGYECTLCQLKFPLLLGTRKQQKVFREHYLVSHTDRYKCRICDDADSINYSNRTQLFAHLSSIHGISTMERYHNAINNYPDTGKETMRCSKPGIKTCKICGMPGQDLRSSDYRHHLLSHMNEEEKMEALALEGRRYKELTKAPTQQQLASDAVNQCQICGKFITFGKLGLIRHQSEAHPDQETDSPKNKKRPKAMCNICGVVLCSKKSLEIHTNRLHPDGKWDGPYKCKFPECPHNSSDEPSLKTHIEVEHGQSKEATNGVLCRVCGKVLSATWGLKTHGLVHSGERPWNCHICPKTFPLKTTLKIHLLTNHGIGAEVFKCEVEGCGKLFPMKRYFNFHMRKEHGVFSIKCKAARENLNSK